MDLLSDMMARIKNAQRRGLLKVMVLNNRLCRNVLDCLFVEGFIRGYSIKGYECEVLLKYKNGVPVLFGCKRLSTPGFRLYMDSNELRKRFLRNEWIIFTSSKGVFMNNALLFNKIKVGGEALLKVW